MAENHEFMVQIVRDRASTDYDRKKSNRDRKKQQQ
jgi:hypothetical protein